MTSSQCEAHPTRIAANRLAYQSSKHIDQWRSVGRRKCLQWPSSLFDQFDQRLLFSWRQNEAFLNEHSKSFANEIASLGDAVTVGKVA